MSLGINETYSKAEREEILRKMQEASDKFYRMAVYTGCHGFVEFCGLMNEYIKLCKTAHDKGIDFTNTNVHSGQPLPMEPHHARYLGEKFGCIFGPSLVQPDNSFTFLEQLGFQMARPLETAHFDAEEHDAPSV